MSGSLAVAATSYFAGPTHEGSPDMSDPCTPNANAMRTLSGMFSTANRRFSGTGNRIDSLTDVFRLREATSNCGLFSDRGDGCATRSIEAMVVASSVTQSNVVQRASMRVRRWAFVLG